jgi:hypothetical protein
MKDVMWRKFSWIFIELNKRLGADSDFSFDTNNYGGITVS